MIDIAKWASDCAKTEGGAGELPKSVNEVEAAPPTPAAEPAPPEPVTPANDEILAALPETASGNAMSAERYMAFRGYLTTASPARLIDYRGISGIVVSATPPTEECPAGTIAMLTDEGTKADYDARALRYPDLRPVANTAWIEVEPYDCGMDF